MNANQENLLASIRVHSRLIRGMISRTGAKAQRNDTLSVSAPLREEETFLDNYIYKSYQDKSWSIVDCISFVVMRDMEIINALTFDRHFEQAGFHILL